MSEWTAESVTDLLIRHLPWSDSRYSEGSGFYDLSLEPNDARRIADELNATLGSGTCPFARPTDLTDGCAALERIAELEELVRDE